MEPFQTVDLIHIVFDYDSLDDLNIQVFAGVGINLLLVQFTPSVTYDFTQSIWGATFSTHIKL